MSGLSGAHPAAGPGATPPVDDHARLRRAAHQLEAVFQSYLFHAMRDTVHEDGVLPASSENDLFTSMLDDRLAQVAADRSTRGLGEALYRQLSRHLPPPQAPGTPGRV